MLKVLFLCTENACRSQMAEGLINYDLIGQVQAFSAGVRPSRVNPRAVQVMGELGIDISGHRSKSVDDLTGEQFDLVITVCDQAQQQCPNLSGETRDSCHGCHGWSNHDKRPISHKKTVTNP